METKRPMLLFGLVVALLAFIVIVLVSGFLGYIFIILGALVKAGEGNNVMVVIYLIVFALMILTAIVGFILTIIGIKNSKLPANLFESKKGIFKAIVTILIVNAVLVGVLLIFSLAQVVDGNQNIVQIILSIVEFVALIISCVLIAISMRQNKRNLIQTEPISTKQPQDFPNNEDKNTPIAELKQQKKED